MTQKAFKYKAYPTRQQEESMRSLLNTHRHLYNDALAERKAVYETEKRSVSFAEQCKSLTQNRKTNSYLAKANATSCQRTLRRLDRAMQAFFRRVKSGENPGYPRFKGRGRFDSVEFTIGDGAKLTKNNRAYFMGVGDVKIKMHRPFQGQIKTARLKKEADGWHVIFICDLPDYDKLPSENPPLGIDLGLKSFLVDSHGEQVKPPQPYRKALKKLKRLHRAVARKKKGGSNRGKSIRHLAKFSQHVANQRRDFHHKVARALVDNYGKIAHEDLHVQGMVRGLNLAKSVHDAGWSQFLGILKHKAESAGVEVIGVDPKNTTQMCSQCGCVPDTKLTLKERVYHCLHCGFTVDRDHNAAMNIKNRAWIEPLGVNQGDYLMDFSRSPVACGGE